MTRNFQEFLEYVKFATENYKLKVLLISDSYLGPKVICSLQYIDYVTKNLFST